MSDPRPYSVGRCDMCKVIASVHVTLHCADCMDIVDAEAKLLRFAALSLLTMGAWAFGEGEPDGEALADSIYESIKTSGVGLDTTDGFRFAPGVEAAIKEHAR